MAINVGARRSQIASLITRDLEEKREQKKRTTAADLLKARMGITGRRDVAEIQQTAATGREKMGQVGATYRQNLITAGDKAVQQMRGQQAYGVQKLRGTQGMAKQTLLGEQVGEQGERGAYHRRWEAEEESSRGAAQLATIPVMDVGDYIYDAKKKKKEDDYLSIPE